MHIVCIFQSIGLKKEYLIHFEVLRKTENKPTSKFPKRLSNPNVIMILFVLNENYEKYY